MDKDKPFSHPRWRDIPQGESIGHVEYTEEEKQENREKLRKHLRKIGIIEETDPKQK